MPHQSSRSSCIFNNRWRASTKLWCAQLTSYAWTQARDKVVVLHILAPDRFLVGKKERETERQTDTQTETERWKSFESASIHCPSMTHLTELLHRTLNQKCVLFLCCLFFRNNLDLRKYCSWNFFNVSDHGFPCSRDFTNLALCALCSLPHWRPKRTPCFCCGASTNTDFRVVQIFRTFPSFSFRAVFWCSRERQVRLLSKCRQYIVFVCCFEGSPLENELDKLEILGLSPLFSLTLIAQTPF